MITSVILPPPPCPPYSHPLITNPNTLAASTTLSGIQSIPSVTLDASSVLSLTNALNTTGNQPGMSSMSGPCTGMSGMTGHEWYDWYK